MSIPSWFLPVLIAALVVVLLALWCLLYRPVAGARGQGAHTDYRSPGSTGSTGRVGGRLRVATYNICGGRGLDGRVDLERIARDLLTIDADIVSLQEVHDTFAQPRQLEWLARRLAIAAIRAPVRWRGFRRQRNNGLLTRLPVGQWQRLPLGRTAAVPFRSGSGKRLIRQLLWADVPIGDTCLRVLLTHLSTEKTDGVAGGRPRQLDQVTDELLRTSPAVLLGDLNTRRDDPRLQSLLASGEAVDGLHEQLNKDDPRRIDWILVRGARVCAAGAINSGASDHPLYWCDVEI